MARAPATAPINPPATNAPFGVLARPFATVATPLPKTPPLAPLANPEDEIIPFGNFVVPEPSLLFTNPLMPLF